jgi:hemolysin activation/secretion protein
VAGNSGYFVESEMHWAPPEANGLDVFALADFGQIFSTFPDKTTMASVGAGLSYNLRNSAIFEVTAAVPVMTAVSDQSYAVYGKVSGTFR